MKNLYIVKEKELVYSEESLQELKYSPQKKLPVAIFFLLKEGNCEDLASKDRENFSVICDVYLCLPSVAFICFVLVVLCIYLLVTSIISILVVFVHVNISYINHISCYLSLSYYITLLYYFIILF